jgi:MFS family permease
MAWLGWRTVFVLFGCASFLWLWPWLRTPQGVAPPQARAAGHGPSALAILQRRELWGSCLGHFCETYVFYLVLSWLPLYLVRVRGFSLAEMAPLGAGVYALFGAASVLTGWLSDRSLASGVSVNRVRKSALIAGFAGVAVCMAACAFAGPLGSLLAMAGCGICLGIVMTPLYATVQSLAGPAATGRWMGVQNFFGNIAGVVAPVVTGIVIDRTGGFSLAFLIAAVVALLGMVAYGVLVGRIEPIDWRTAEPAQLLTALPPQG